MENNGFVTTIFIFTLVVLVLQPAPIHAYTLSTHESLTRHTIAEYERLVGDTFSDDDIAHIVRGAAEEDAHLRPLNHFYDPVNNRGLVKLFTEQNASPLWATNPYLQALFSDSRSRVRRTKLLEHPDDHSYPRAVYEYVHGDRTRALRSLGHTLHLLQDLTSPPHTRNDAHTGSFFDGASPYEEFTADRTPAVTLSRIPSASDVETLLRNTARYTNRHFLSADTVFEGYGEPKLGDLQKQKGFYVLGFKLLTQQSC